MGVIIDINLLGVANIFPQHIDKLQCRCIIKIAFQVQVKISTVKAIGDTKGSSHKYPQLSLYQGCTAPAGVAVWKDYIFESRYSRFNRRSKKNVTVTSQSLSNVYKSLCKSFESFF